MRSGANSFIHVVVRSQCFWLVVLLVAVPSLSWQNRRFSFTTGRKALGQTPLFVLFCFVSVCAPRSHLESGDLVQITQLQQALERPVDAQGSPAKKKKTVEQNAAHRTRLLCAKQGSRVPKEGWISDRNTENVLLAQRVRDHRGWAALCSALETIVALHAKSAATTPTDDGVAGEGGGGNGGGGSGSGSGTSSGSGSGSGTGSGGKVVVQVDGVGVGLKGWAMAGAAAGVEFSTGPAEGS